ncbi:MAG: dephospho-CoA kinase [Candidatus Nanopelagicaceae bacterium]
MLTVALTGGIGSGKSLAGEYFEALGAIVIDSDQLARDVIERGSDGFDQVIDRFGDGILKDGEIDRTALARVVFTDADARRDLEEIIHPRVRARSEEIVTRAGTNAIVINQIPLLFETKGADRFDLVITIEASEELRIERASTRGLKEYEVRQRMANQASEEDRRSIADIVIVNDGSAAELLTEVERVWNEVLLPRLKQSK